MDYMALVLVGVVLVYLLILRPVLRFFPRVVSGTAGAVVLAASIGVAKEAFGIDPNVVIIVIAVLVAPAIIAEPGSGSSPEAVSGQGSSPPELPEVPEGAA